MLYILQPIYTAGSVCQLKIGYSHISNVANDVTRKMTFASLDGGDDGEHDDVALVQIFLINVTQDTFTVNTGLFKSII